MKFFYCEVTWYDNYTDQTQEDKVFIFAANYQDACCQLSVHFPDISKINIELVNDDTGGTSILFIEGNNEDMVQSIKNSNTY